MVTMKINIQLSNNRSVQISNSIIGKTFENEATILNFLLPEEMGDKNLYLEFEKPDNTKFVTPKLKILTPEETEEVVTHYVEYSISNSLLDIPGDLKCEVVLKNNDGLVFKTYTMQFTILNSINASEELPEQYPDFVSETQKVIDLIEIEGTGDKYLSNDGTYKEVQGGTNDYDNLNNKPISYLTGTEDNIIYLKDLDTGNYIINGLYMPYENADISSTGNNTYIKAEKTDTDIYIVLDDVINNNKEHYRISIDGSSYEREVISYANIQNKLTISTSTRTSIYTTLNDNTSYQCSVEPTRIILKFPTEREVGFKCNLVFKTGETIPTFTCDYDIKWHGDSVTDNVFTINANKFYTIDFWQDVNNFNAEVREV